MYSTSKLIKILKIGQQMLQDTTPLTILEILRTARLNQRKGE